LAETEKESRNLKVVTESEKPQPKKIFGIPQKDIMEEFVYPLIKKEFKNQLGISTEHTSQKNKTAFGRTMGTLKEFLQGTWWVWPLVIGSVGLTLIALKFISKLLGV